MSTTDTKHTVEIIQRKNLWITLRRKDNDVDITRIPFDVELSSFLTKIDPDKYCLVINQGNETVTSEVRNPKKQRR